MEDSFYVIDMNPLWGIHNTLFAMATFNINNNNITKGGVISFSDVLPEGPAIIITPTINRYPLTPGWRVANVDKCLVKRCKCLAEIRTLNPYIEFQVNEPLYHDTFTIDNVKGDGGSRGSMGNPLPV